MHMNFESIEEVFDSLDGIINEIKKDRRYVESYDSLVDLRANKDEIIYGVEEIKLSIAQRLHDTDASLPMHSAVAKLVVDLYKDCIEEGNSDAMCNLGALYYTGRAGTQDYNKAAYYYDMADKKGNRQATENLGYIYYYGRTGAKDYKKAFHFFLKGAIDESLCSLYKVGDCYKNGYYVDKDPIEAFNIYSKCLDKMEEQDIPYVGADIYMRMGDCFYKGIGTDKDLLIALKFYSLAENLFYYRLVDGDFYQQRSLERVIEIEDKIRKEIKKDVLPDLSWAGYGD